MARLPLLLLALSAVAAKAFVSFHDEYSLSYCEASHDKECECYNHGYQYEHIECSVENDQSCANVSARLVSRCRAQTTGRTCGAWKCVPLLCHCVLDDVRCRWTA